MSGMPIVLFPTSVIYAECNLYSTSLSTVPEEMTNLINTCIGAGD